MKAAAETVSFTRKVSEEPAGVVCPHSSMIVFPSVPGVSVMVYSPPTTMGPDNFTRITGLSLSASQTPLAPVTLTGEGPVILKSLPSPASELQWILFENTSWITRGAHPGGVRLSRGVGCGTAGLLKPTEEPAGTGVKQLSSNVLLSVPLVTVSV